MKHSIRLLKNVHLCWINRPLKQWTPAVLDQACAEKIVQAINAGKRLGFYEPVAMQDSASSSYYQYAAFVIQRAWIIEDQIRITVEPMHTQAGWYFWEAMKKEVVSFVPAFRGEMELGTMRVKASDLEYEFTDAFLP